MVSNGSTLPLVRCHENRFFSGRNRRPGRRCAAHSAPNGRFDGVRGFIRQQITEKGCPRSRWQSPRQLALRQQGGGLSGVATAVGEVEPRVRNALSFRLELKKVQ